MSVTNKREFEAATKDGQAVKLAVLRPTNAQRHQADLARARTWGELVQKKVIPEARLTDVIREQGLWDDAKEAELAAIDARLAENLALLPDANGRVRKAGPKASALREAAVWVRRTALNAGARNYDAATIGASGDTTA